MLLISYLRRVSKQEFLPPFVEQLNGLHLWSNHGRCVHVQASTESLLLFYGLEGLALTKWLAPKYIVMSANRSKDFQLLPHEQFSESYLVSSVGTSKVREENSRRSRIVSFFLRLLFPHCAFANQDTLARRR